MGFEIGVNGNIVFSCRYFWWFDWTSALSQLKPRELHQKCVKMWWSKKMSITDLT